MFPMTLDLLLFHHIQDEHELREMFLSCWWMEEASFQWSKLHYWTRTISQTADSGMKQINAATNW